MKRVGRVALLAGGAALVVYLALVVVAAQVTPHFLPADPIPSGWSAPAVSP
jgi:hypothetical protein